jgi:cytochrome P450 family 6
MHLLKIYLATMFPNAARKLNVRFNAKAVTTFFSNIVKETIDQRERDQVRRKDFMQILLDLKEKGELECETDDSWEMVDDRKSNNTTNGMGLTFEDIAAQAFVFFFAGFETSSTAMTYGLHLLARYPEIQEKGRQEVKQVMKKYGGKLTFEGVTELRYIENIISGR